MATKPKVIVEDLGLARYLRAVKYAGGWTVTVGVHTEDASHPGPIDNVGLAAIHEFGANFLHPGGTPYTVASVGGGGRSGGFVGEGRVRFLPKGSGDAIGVTRSHRITIPERSFLRASFDKNVDKYVTLLRRGLDRIAMASADPRQVVGQIGEVAVADIVNLIRSHIPPPLKPATIARKGSTTPLIDSGQLVQSIKPKVTKQ